MTNNTGPNDVGRFPGLTSLSSRSQISVLEASNLGYIQRKFGVSSFDFFIMLFPDCYSFIITCVIYKLLFIFQFRDLFSSFTHYLSICDFGLVFHPAIASLSVTDKEKGLLLLVSNCKGIAFSLLISGLEQAHRRFSRLSPSVQIALPLAPSYCGGCRLQ
jgi:hypothetical protein